MKKHLRIKANVNSKKKIVKCRKGIIFIKQCLNKEKLPKLRKIYLMNNDLKNDQKFITSVRNEITQRELESKFKYKKQNEKLLKELEKE